MATLIQQKPKKTQIFYCNFEKTSNTSIDVDTNPDFGCSATAVKLPRAIIK